MQGDKKSIALIWRGAWQDKRFKTITIVGGVLLLAILVSFPFFFNYIEARKGIVLNDWVLARLPSFDVSLPTFIIIWSMTVLLWIRCIQDPTIFIIFLVGFILLSLSRMVTITLIPLDPPQGLIPLKDPLSSIFYGGMDVFIEKDLFYSGHTSIQVLMFFTFKKRIDKILALLSSIAIGSCVLVQHVHYTVDVVGAVIFSYLIYRLSILITKVK